MLITQRSHWTPRSLEAPFQPGHSSGILWLLVTPCRVSGSQGEVIEPQMGKREGGQEHLPPPPAKQPGVCSCIPTTWSLPWSRHDFLSPLETVLSLSSAGTAKSDGVSGPPQGLAWFPPASQEVVASQAAPEGTQIGSGLKQLTIWPAPPLCTWFPAPTQHACTGARAPISPSSCSPGQSSSSPGRLYGQPTGSPQPLL